MGELVPEDFALASLVNDAERLVVEAFRDGLSDSWLVLPQVAIRTPNRDHEIDVVLLHQTFGLLVIEVKGHRVSIRKGEWQSDGRRMEPQPLEQAHKNAYALRDLVRSAVPHLIRLEVDYGVAVPNTTGVGGQLPPGAQLVQVLTASALEDVTDAIELLALARFSAVQLAPADVEQIVRLLRPDVDFSWDPNTRLRASRRRLDDLSAAQSRTLERLDVNRRVIGIGAAGTGKTRLATAWARRAYARGERVLFTCYNDPLADRIAEQLPQDDALRVGSFFQVALGLEGMPPLDVPVDADHEWWNHRAVGHLHANWHLIADRFDTIVVDEAQDFSPAWIAQLASLLDPEGPRRMLLVADPVQELYGRGFVVPDPGDGWTQCELVSNCRNARSIATLLRRKLGGAAAPANAPEAAGLHAVAVEEGESVAAATTREIHRLAAEGRETSNVLVLTFSSRLRDELRSVCGLVRWEERSNGIVCETVHRAKGLEADTVVLVADTDEVADHLLYIGISRAVAELVVIGPRALADRLGLQTVTGS